MRPAPSKNGPDLSSDTHCSTGPCWGLEESRNLDLFFSDAETVRHPLRGRVRRTRMRGGVRGGYEAFTTGIGGQSATGASALASGPTRWGLPVLLGGQRPKGTEPDAGAELKGLKNFRTPAHRRHPAEQLHGTGCTLCWLRCWKKRRVCRCWAFCRNSGGRHRFPPSGPLYGSGSGKFTAEAGPSGRRGGGAHRLAPPAGPLRKEPPALPVQRRRLRPVSASPWRRTRRSALPTPRRWRPFGTPGQRWSFSAPSATRLCRKTSAGCICPAATRNFTQEN